MSAGVVKICRQGGGRTEEAGPDRPSTRASPGPASSPSPRHSAKDLQLLSPLRLIALALGLVLLCWIRPGMPRWLRDCLLAAALLLVIGALLITPGPAA